jgi:hypothetical protein
MIAQRLLRELNLQPYIRRFRNISGCILPIDEGQLVTGEFVGMAYKLEGFIFLLIDPDTRDEIADDGSIAWVFVHRSTVLKQASYVERINGSNRTLGCGIANRLFAASPVKEIQDNGRLII